MQKVKDFIINNFIIIYSVYFITLFVDATSLIIDYPILETVTKYTRYIVYAFLALRLFFLFPDYKDLILSTKWKEKSIIIKTVYIVSIILVFSLIMCFLTTSYRKCLFILFILLSSYKTDYKKILKTTMILQIALSSIIVVLCLLGFTQDYIVARDDISRHSLGFAYVTFGPQFLLFASVIYIYEVGSKISLRELFEMQLLNGIYYKLTDSRTEFYLLELIIVVVLIVKILKKYNKDKIFQSLKKGYSAIFACLFPLIPLASFIAAMSYRFGGIWVRINDLVSNRIEQTYLCIQNYGIKPFGSNIEFLPYDLKHRMKYGSYQSNYVDNDYMQLLLTEGWIFLFCLVILISIMLLLLYKKEKYREILLCSLFLFVGMMNPRVVNLLYCPILFIMIPTIAEYSKDIKEKVIKK